MKLSGLRVARLNPAVKPNFRIKGSSLELILELRNNVSMALLSNDLARGTLNSILKQADLKE